MAGAFKSNVVAGIRDATAEVPFLLCMTGSPEAI
jgi:hypothetical protein